MLEKVRQLAETGGIKSLLALEIGLAGTYSIYNSVWLLETSSGIKSLIVETPEKESKLPESRELALDSTAYALLWSELEDLRAWDTPSDAKTVGLRADVPVFTATFCRDGRLHRVRMKTHRFPPGERTTVSNRRAGDTTKRLANSCSGRETGQSKRCD